jgi:cytochrome c oxidase subunit 2
MGEQASPTSRLRRLLVSPEDVRHRAQLAVVGGLLIFGTTGCLAIDSFNPVTRQGLQVSNLYNLELIISGLLLLLIIVILTYSLIRFRARLGAGEPPQVQGNTRLEVVWTATPELLLAIIYILTV